MKKILAIAAMALLTLAASAQKLGRVNFTELYQLAPEADSARDQINAMQNEAQETFNSMVEEYQTKANQYQQKSATWTAAIKEAKEKPRRRNSWTSRTASRNSSRPFPRNCSRSRPN